MRCGRSNTLMPQRQLGHANVMPCQLGPHKAPEAMRRDMLQSDLLGVGRDHKPQTTLGERRWCGTEATASKRREEVGTLQRPVLQPRGNRQVRLMRQTGPAGCSGSARWRSAMGHAPHPFSVVAAYWRVPTASSPGQERLPQPRSCFGCEAGVICVTSGGGIMVCRPLRAPCRTARTAGRPHRGSSTRTRGAAGTASPGRARHRRGRPLPLGHP